MRGERGVGKVVRMPTSYLPYEPNQDVLLPHSLRDWLPDCRTQALQPTPPRAYAAASYSIRVAAPRLMNIEDGVNPLERPNRSPSNPF